MTTVKSPSRIQLENVCVVIPVFRDAEPLQLLLGDLSSGVFNQIIVSFADESAFRSKDTSEVHFLHAPRNRGGQIAAAISTTNAEWIWILHADVRVSRCAIHTLADTLGQSDWGAFKIYLAGTSRLLNVISFMMNWRSRLTSIYTGDQGMYVRRTLLDCVGGYPPIKLMEDVECSRRLRRFGRGSQLPNRLTVSARKWDHEGVIRTVFRMWGYRLLYFFGASSEHLANRYYR